jgi:hypothetical protein
MDWLQKNRFVYNWKYYLYSIRVWLTSIRKLHSIASLMENHLCAPFQLWRGAFLLVSAGVPGTIGVHYTQLDHTVIIILILIT